MIKLTEKPHLIFLLAIPFIMFFGVLSGDAVLDINLHDTYFVISYLHLAMLISVLFVIIGIGYWVVQKAKRAPSNKLNCVLVRLTIICTL